jgi:hypothetical protein
MIGGGPVFAEEADVLRVRGIEIGPREGDNMWLVPRWAYVVSLLTNVTEELDVLLLARIIDTILDTTGARDAIDTITVDHEYAQISRKVEIEDNVEAYLRSIGALP